MITVSLHGRRPGRAKTAVVLLQRRRVRINWVKLILNTILLPSKRKLLLSSLPKQQNVFVALRGSLLIRQDTRTFTWSLLLKQLETIRRRRFAIRRTLATPRVPRYLSRYLRIGPL